MHIFTSIFTSKLEFTILVKKKNHLCVFVWVYARWLQCDDYVWVHCVGVWVCECVGQGRGRGSCVSLCLVLTHPAINCVSTAAVCISQIESSATGPFCFSPLGWASRPPHSHSSQPCFKKISILLCIYVTLFLSHSFPSLLCFFVVLSLSVSWANGRPVSNTRRRHSFTCCSFFSGLANK